MSGKFTKALRQEIVREFAVRHNGHFNPALFLQEVRRIGSSHPAHAWFEWDAKKAAQAHQLEQARNFARDLRVSFRVEEVAPTPRLTVRATTMPLVLSPMETRRAGGGYVLVNPAEPEHMAEHCRQAASALRSWLARYQAAVEHAGCSPDAIRGIISELEAAGAVPGKAA